MVRFRFRGCDRETGKPVDGHVEAPDKEAAYQVLSDHGIVTETLRVDPGSLNVSPDTSAISQFTEALESALEMSSSQVAFDDLTKRYRGKKVWVVNREKIRQQVAQVVDSTLAASEANPDGGITARERVAQAISGLFDDTRNIASEHNAESLAKMRAKVSAADGAGAAGIAAMTDAGLAEQIGRLSGVVEQAEGLIAAMQAALRNVESGGEPRRRRVGTDAAPTVGDQSGVLREIFQSNLDLRRAMASSASPIPVKATETNSNI
jgi:hypothetical protein